MISGGFCRSPVAAGLLTLVLGAGCPGSLDEMAAEEAVDGQELAANDAALMASAAEDLADGDRTAAALAARAEARARSRYQPAGCATISRQGNQVVHVLAGCSGRFGLLRMTGRITATYADVAQGVEVTVASERLRINQATMDVSTTGLLSFSGETTTLTVTSRGDGTGRRGNRFERQGQFTAQANRATECLDLSGAWQLRVGAASRSTTVKGLKACKDRCPSAGSIEHKGFRGREVTVTFDGSNTAKWKTGAGRDGTVELECRSAP
jgi:hypothetical protein